MALRPRPARRRRRRREGTHGHERQLCPADPWDSVSVAPPGSDRECADRPRRESADRSSSSRLTTPLRPRRGGASTSQGHPLAIFRRAIERGNLLVAEATANELPPLNLTDALDLTILIARKDPRRHPRVAARWLLRYPEECDDATIDEAAMVAACLAALAGDRHGDAALTLRAIAERATSRRRARGIA
jgi:hypothetical protein